jgi:hypothetical protein
LPISVQIATGQFRIEIKVWISEERIPVMRQRKYRPQMENMESRDVPTTLTNLHAAVRRPPAFAPLRLKGTSFGAMIDTGPGSVKLDTGRPPFNLFKSSNYSTVYGQFNRDVATNQVSGWLVVGVSGRQIKVDVTGNARNTSLRGFVVNLRYTGSAEFANSIQPGNIRLMLNTPIRGRYSLTFA